MNTEYKVHSIEEVLADFSQGKMVIMVDDEDRENEGDLLIAAEYADAECINFMATEGRGLICLTLTEDRCNQLELPLMVSRNGARFSTNFTVSIEASLGVTTGISAHDRATTVQAAIAKQAKPEDIVTPGHIFPIKAQIGGVLTRAGHTEAGVDMAKISGFEPASVICEILKPDGSMARLPDLVKFAHQHNLKVGTIADLIRYRLQHDPTLVRLSESFLSLKQGQFRAFVFQDKVEGGTHIAVIKGELSTDSVVPVRVHVHRGPLDVVLNPESPWSWTLENALTAIAQVNKGVVIILSYSETPEELVARINQDSSANRDRTHTEVNEMTNLRMLGAGGQILANLGVRKILALGREKKAHGLSGFGLEIVDYIDSPQKLNDWYKDNE